MLRLLLFGVPGLLTLLLLHMTCLQLVAGAEVQGGLHTAAEEHAEKGASRGPLE